MNKRALVLAADSAVTVTRWENGNKEERYFKGANKIFQLSNFQPLGLMIFDTADLQRVPWEIIVKEFRSQLGDKKCGKIADYAKVFFNFVSSNNHLFPQDYRTEILLENIDHVMVRHLILADESDSVKREKPGSIEAIQAKINTLDAMHSYLTSDTPDSVSKIIALTLHEHKNLLTNSARSYLDIVEIKPYDSEKLIEIALHAFFRFPDAFLTLTGLVVGGYGDNDFFPSYEEYSCSGFVGQSLHWNHKGGYGISPRDQGYIKAFATTAMVDTFTLGFAPDVYLNVKKNLETVIRDFAGQLNSSLGATQTPNLEALIGQAIDLHTQMWTEAMRKQHADPLRRVVGSLPTAEMASLAETLIELESLKEKVTQPSESVGGPIDVAVITKAEGFIWTKRKHYFDPKLNPRFVARQHAEMQHSLGG